MIVGSLNGGPLPDFLRRHATLSRAIDWILALPENPADALVELDGPDLRANIHGYATRERTSCVWESHRHTADFQYMLHGGEVIDWTSAQAPSTGSSYDAGRDFETHPSSIAPQSSTRLGAGDFAFFLPGELHRPMIADGTHARVRKLVVKIHARLLEAP